MTNHILIDKEAFEKYTGATVKAFSSITILNLHYHAAKKSMRAYLMYIRIISENIMLIMPTPWVTGVMSDLKTV